MRTTSTFFIQKSYLSTTQSVPLSISILSGIFTTARVLPNAYLVFKFGNQYSPVLGVLLGLGTGVPLSALTWHTGRQELMKLKKCIMVKTAGMTMLLTAVNFFPSIYTSFR